MKADGYLFVNYEPDLDGKVLLDLDFLRDGLVLQVDVIDEWIAQLEILKSKLSYSGDDNE